MSNMTPDPVADQNADGTEAGMRAPEPSDLTGGATEAADPSTPEPSSTPDQSAPSADNATSATLSDPIVPETKHLFRVLHAIYEGDNPNAVHTHTTAEHDALGALQYIASHVKDVSPLIAALTALL